MPEPPEKWLEFADGDLEAAECLKMGETPVLRGIAAFHVQQAAEKLLKALLVLNEKPVPKIHDLASLYQKVIVDFPAVEPFAEPLIQMSIWAVLPRYPGDYPELFIQEIEDALFVVRKLRKIISEFEAL